MQEKTCLVSKDEDFIVNFKAGFEDNDTQAASCEAELSGNGASPYKTEDGNGNGYRDLNFSELIEKRLGEFVKMIRTSEGGNLYNLLIQEVEKPLVKLVLEETRGNQVQAAKLLGMHRNTLRRKMRELDIPALRKGQ